MRYFSRHTLSQSIIPPKIEVPKGWKIVDPTAPRFDPAASKIKVLEAGVHGKGVKDLSIKEMLREARKYEHHPVDALEDVRTIMRRWGRNTLPDLLVGVRLCDQDDKEYFIVLGRGLGGDMNAWFARFHQGGDRFNEGCSVLCYVNP